MLTFWRQTLGELLAIRTPVYFLVLCILALALLLTRISLVENQTLAFQILQEDGEFGIFRLLQSLQAAAIPFLYAWKITLTAFVLWVGAFMFGYRITYRQMWHIALVAETVFLLPELIRTFWWVAAGQQPDFIEIRNFYPLSLINLADTSTLAPRLRYPLKALNLFEVAYWWVLTEAIHLTAGKQWRYAFAIVFTTYVPLFLLWLWYYTLVYK